MDAGSKIYIIHKGMVGSAIVRKPEAPDKYTVITRNRHV